MYLSHHFLQALESHGEVVIIVQVVQALLMLPLIMPVVSAPPNMAMPVSTAQVSTTAPSQNTCTMPAWCVMCAGAQPKQLRLVTTDHMTLLLQEPRTLCQPLLESQVLSTPDVALICDEEIIEEVRVQVHKNGGFC